MLGRMRHDDDLRDLAARQHNLVSRADALALGLDDVAWRRAASSGQWVRVAPRVLRVAGAAPARGESVMAAALDVGLDARVSHSTAAAWWGLPGFRLSPVHLVRTRQTTRPTELAHVHRIRRLEPRWCTTLEGIPIVRPEMVILQLCATEHPARAERALDNAWNLRLLSGRSLRSLFAEHGERGRNGIALLRQLVDARGDDYVPPASNLEARFERVVEPLPVAFRRQVDLGDDAWTGRVDFLAVDRPLVVEVQSERYHSALLDRTADALRVERLSDAGFVVIEVTDTELWTDGAAVRARVATAAALAARSVA